MHNCTQETDWRIKNSSPTFEDYCSGLQENHPVSNFNRIFCNLTNTYGYFFKAIKLLCWENAAGAPAARTNFVDFFSHFHARPFTPEWDLLCFSPDNVIPVCVCVCAYYFEITLHNVFSFLFTVSSFLCHGDITEAVLSTLFQGEILFPSGLNLPRMSDRPNAQVEKLNFHFSQHSALVLN